MASMISLILNALGLVTRVEHEAVKLRSAADGQLIRRLIDERDDWQAKFKLAATDLAKQAEEIEAYDGAFAPDVLAVIDVMTDYRADSAEQIAADASYESGLSITPARVSAIRKALHTLDLAGFGSLFDDDSAKVAGRGYWLTKSGSAIQGLKRSRDRKKGVGNG